MVTMVLKIEKKNTSHSIETFPNIHAERMYRNVFKSLCEPHPKHTNHLITDKSFTTILTINSISYAHYLHIMFLLYGAARKGVSFVLEQL